MGLDTIIRSGVAIANKITRPLQVTVTWEQWISQDGAGKPTYDPTIRSFRAVVERKQRRFVTTAGIEVLSTHHVFVMERLTPHGSVDGRREPLDERDRLTLPDGTTGVILMIDGVADAGTPIRYTNENGLTEDGVADTYYHDIWLGPRGAARS